MVGWEVLEVKRMALAGLVLAFASLIAVAFGSAEPPVVLGTSNAVGKQAHAELSLAQGLVAAQPEEGGEGAGNQRRGDERS